jgi:hypothetical protein
MHMRCGVSQLVLPKNYWKSTILSDPKLEEIRKFRDEVAANFHFDVRAIGLSARERDAAGDRPVVSREPRPPLVFHNLPGKKV